LSWCCYKIIPYTMEQVEYHTEPFLLAISTICGTHLLNGVYATIYQISSSNDHVIVVVQADGGVNLHIADF
jgi:hypothetical protein